MARDLSRWVLLGVLVVAGFFLFRVSSLASYGRRYNRPSVSAERAREGALAEQWRAAESQALILQYRARMVDVLRQRAAADSPGVAVLVIGSDSARTRATPVLAEALARAWREAGLGVTKVSVGVVAMLDGFPTLPGQLRPVNTQDVSHFLPDSLAPTTCLVLLPINPTWLERLASRRGLATLLAQSLGPCGFIARDGMPGERVAAWLSARHYDLAAAFLPSGQEAQADFLGELFGLNWTTPYALPTTGVGCLAGREADCRAAVARGTATRTSPWVEQSRWWNLSEMKLVGANHYLADVHAAIGPQRFHDVWTTTLPVDSALTLALATPVGRWTADWQAQRATRIRLGPGVAPGAWLFGLVAVLVGVAGGIGFAVRREVS